MNNAPRGTTRPILRPSDFSCPLKDAPPGPFLHEAQLCMRTSRFRENGTVLAYGPTGSEFVHGDAVVVHPVCVAWVPA